MKYFSSLKLFKKSKLFADLARAFPDSPEKRLNGFLVAKIQDLLQSYSLRFKLLNDDVINEVESRKGGGGGGFGGGDKKGGMGMIAMAMMMKGAMGAMGELKRILIKFNFNMKNNSQPWEVLLHLLERLC